MNDTAKQLKEIETLVAERRKYEQWVAQLEARQSSTPEHVFVKVHADYAARLVAAQERLAAETGAVQALVTSLQATLSEQEKAIGAKSDDRSEAELRAAVGEYGEKEWEKIRSKLDAAIAELSRERDTTLRELDSLRALLAEAAMPGVVERPAPEPAALATAPSALADAVARESDAAQPAPERAAIAPPAGAKGSAEFDELAFLKSVVGRPTPGSKLTAEQAPAAAPPAAHEPPPARTSSGDLFASSDPSLELSDDVKRESGAFSAANLGTFGETTPRSSEAVKTLKCGECGTLNFATEWYCERCGGELAAF